MPLSAIERAPRNPKQHDAEGIRASMARFGVADLPVLDERTGRLVSGHGRLEQLQYLADLPPAALEEILGRPGLPGGVQLDPASGQWTVPVVRGWASSSDEEAETYLLYANKSTMNAGFDDNELAQIMAELVAFDEGLASLAGFDSELDDLFRSTDYLGNQATAFLDELGADPAASGQPWGPADPVSAAAAAEPAEVTSYAQPAPSEPAVAYFTMSWTVREEQRAVVRNAISVAQKARGLGTSADALVAIAEHFMAGTRNPG